ncbi:uncharacterized protein PITG_13071 [Phytophthora infestans T30-4]|uniref:DDE-1 domain-containing protein n=1 Tax=Phytophthora infestans (strain T30-4) TaxID=403677 RepID=D0NK84_PHYIT|nr:uncharacterized protein PITG_13071 [Phytophthora infestans T30-4]EEY59921.1 hypothetical protein PITG_13071 [Phytophthora infestans T30-4]|eukprot:XP_002900606.1 hypothetical protein PITG_13071 [Phytophthora infestans T30-4]
MVCLPANATHLFQPLGVADPEGGYSIDKTTAVRFSCLAWTRCHFSTNVSSCFHVCGLYPLSLVRMTQRMAIYTRNGSPTDFRIAAWLMVDLAIRQEERRPLLAVTF